jgi:hypothetical protein
VHACVYLVWWGRGGTTPPPLLNSAVASAPSPVTLTFAPPAAIPSWLLRRAPRLVRLNCPQLPAPTCETPVRGFLLRLLSGLRVPRARGHIQHLSQHSCISSSAPLRGARAAPLKEGSRYTLGPIGRPSLCCCHLLRLLSLSTLSPPPNVPQKISTLRPKKLPLPVRCRRYSLIVFSVCAAGGSLTLLGTIRLFCDAKIIQRAKLVSKLRPSCLKTSSVCLFVCLTFYFRRELVRYQLLVPS